MFELLKDYATKRVDLLKLATAEKSSLTFGILFFLGIVTICCLSFIVFLFLGIGLLIGSALGNYSYGMLIMAGVCIVIVLICVLLRKPIQNFFANIFLNLINS